MLDRLPLELIQLIIHLALPCHYSPSTYRQRQDTLLALCKTLCLLRTVAQPVLFEVVQLKGVEGVERFVEGVKDKALGARVRDVCVTGTAPLKMLDFHGELAAKLASRCVGVAVLRLCRVSADIASFEGFMNLRHLIVVNGVLSVSRPFRLDALIELSLACPDYNTSELLHLPYFPALRALYTQSTGDHLPLDVLEDWLVQLDCINIDAYDVLITGTAPISPRIVLDYKPGRLVRAIEGAEPKYVAAKCLRLDGTCGEDFSPDDAEDITHALTYDLEGLATALRTAATVPTSLYLPPVDDLRPFDLPEYQEESVRQLLLACRERGIEVVRESAADPRYESLVSPEFWRRCKALKAKEGEEKQEKKGEADGEDWKEK